MTIMAVAPVVPSSARVPVFVINLDRAPERLAHMRGQLERIVAPFERIAAVDGRRLDADAVARATAHDVKARLRPALTRAELGCFLSHAAAWQRVVDGGHAYGCIMEDDVEFASDFSYWLDRTDQYPAGFDVLKLEAIGKHEHRRATVVGTSGRWTIGHCWFGASGAACYIVSNSGARRLLARLLPCDAAVDTAMFRYWENGLRIYDVLPYPARQIGAPSSVQRQGDAALGQARHPLAVRFGPHVHPLDWKPVVYALAAWRRFGQLGLRSLLTRSIPAHDAGLYSKTCEAAPLRPPGP